MSQLLYRQAQETDIPAMAQIRAADWGTEEYWRVRILQYLTQQLHPREALGPRVSFVCLEREKVVGLIAGHLTRRFGCDGELEWVSVQPRYRGKGIASELLRQLAEWFATLGALRVCVDVEPNNEAARRFYRSQGADDLKPHWMIWKDIGQVLRAQRSSDQ